MSDLLIDGGIIIAYVLIAIAAIGFIGSEILYTAKNFSDSKNTVIGIGILIAIVVVGFILGGAISPDQATIDATKTLADFDMTEGIVSKVNGGIVTSYILLTVAVLALVGDLLMGVIKK